MGRFITVKRYLILSCLLFTSFFPAFAQIQENAIPLSAKESLLEITHFEKMFPIDSLDCKKAIRKSVHHFQFACPYYLDLDPENSGEWTETPGGRVWRLGIHSDRAYSLYLNLSLFLSKGARLFVYGPDYQDLKGAYTSVNNNSAKSLTIAPVKGDKLIIELNLPPHVHSYGELKIRKVYHDFYGVLRGEIDSKSQSLRVNSCSEDINCSNGRFWQTEKRSVCKIISNGRIGTGTLVGNTSYDDTPYLLTAHHLVPSEEDAAESIFVFDYETTGCGEELKSTVKILSGASLIATTDHKVDFSLLRLYEKPPQEYRPFYAGWDTKNSASPKNVCIHHPYGGYKQIAIEYHTAISEDIGEGFDENSTVKVPHWEVGTTEQGSSGAPLFNDQHRIIGTLTGGRSSCNYPKDDYFTKFSASWDAYSNPTNQLKHWLDPGQTGMLNIDGYDPYGFSAEYCDTTWNYSAHDKLGLSREGLSWGFISGHNSSGYTQFAERFEPAGALQLNGVYLNIAKAHSSDPLAYIELKIWGGSQLPEEENYSKLLFINDLQPDGINYIPLDSVLKMSEPFFVGYKINYNNPSDTFALYHTEKRSISGLSSMYIFNNGWYESYNAFNMFISLGLGVSGCYGEFKGLVTDRLKIYPNPSTNWLNLDIPVSNAIQKISCFDSNGRVRSVSLKQNETSNTLFFDLPPGPYYLKILTFDNLYYTRFIVAY